MNRTRRNIFLVIISPAMAMPLSASNVAGLDNDLSQVLLLAGNPLLQATAILATIVSIIANFEKVIDKSGAGERHQGLQNITFCILATYLVCTICNVIILTINKFSLEGGLDFSK